MQGKKAHIELSADVHEDKHLRNLILDPVTSACSKFDEWICAFFLPEQANSAGIEEQAPFEPTREDLRFLHDLGVWWR